MVKDNPLPGRELSDHRSEIEIIGMALPQKSTKVPIGEVRPYQTKSEEINETGITYIIGDSDRLAFWLSLDRNYDEEELYEGKE